MLTCGGLFLTFDFLDRKKWVVQLKLESASNYFIFYERFKSSNLKKKNLRKLSAPISLSTFRRFARYKLAKINLDFHYQVMHCFIPFQRGKDLYHLELQISRWKNELWVTQNNSCESLCESLHGTLRPLPSPPQPNENVHHTPVLIRQSWLPQ